MQKVDQINTRKRIPNEKINGSSNWMTIFYLTAEIKKKYYETGTWMMGKCPLPNNIICLPAPYFTITVSGILSIPPKNQK